MPGIFPQEAETEAKARKEESDKAGVCFRGGGTVGWVDLKLFGELRLEKVHPKIGYVYIPGTQIIWPLVLIGVKALVLGGNDLPKTEVVWVPGIYNYIHLFRWFR